MPHYALSDGLVVFCALYGALTLAFPGAGPAAGKMAAAGFLTVAIAAFAGVLRFVTGNEALFETPHLLLSNFAGIVGFAWIATALLARSRASSRARIVMWPLPPLLFAAALTAGLDQELLILSVLFLLLAQFVVLLRLTGDDGTGGVRSMFLILLLFLLIFPMEYLPTHLAGLGWHLYHTLLALWIFALSRTWKTYLPAR